MIFDGGSIKEELLKTMPLHGKARDEDIFKKNCIPLFWK
jgi:hypothetical protein